MGLSPADPQLEPYFALAEELDIPVGIHTGLLRTDRETLDTHNECATRLDRQLRIDKLRSLPQQPLTQMSRSCRRAAIRRRVGADPRGAHRAEYDLARRLGASAVICTGDERRRNLMLDRGEIA